MKKVIIIFLSLISLVVYGAEDINEITTLKMQVKEISHLNNKEIEKVYNISYFLPDTLKKTTLSPKTHKGEIFIYKDGKKTTYLPIFNQVVTQETSAEENIVIELIKFFQEKYRDDASFRRLYNSRKPFKVKKESLDIRILKMRLVKGYGLPSKLEIYSSGTISSEVEIDKIQINEEIKESEFVLNDKTN